jgi:hypothetical protein
MNAIHARSQLRYWPTVLAATPFAHECNAANGWDVRTDPQL